MKQPRVPEYREADGIKAYIKALTLFLKDFCNEAWMANKGHAVESVNGKTGKVQLSAADVNAVKKTGDTMTGGLTVPGFTFKAANLYPLISLTSASLSGIACGISGNLSNGARNIRFYHYHNDQDGASTRYRSIYQLPNATAGLTADTYYNILTTKSAVTVAQGGTGAATAAAARTNLGVSTKAETLLAAYPVGAIYLSTVSTSPASLFGGTWTQLKDRFLLGAGSTYAAAATGGAATHKLTVNEMPSHTHGFQMYYGHNSENATNSSKSGNAHAYLQYYTQSAGGGAAHNNMPPYLVVYMWKRTA